MNTITRSLLILSVLALTGMSPPSTQVEPVHDDIHGVSIEDPYRWLEGSAAPEISGEDPALDQRVFEWTDAQNEYTRGTLDALPHRASIEARLRELMEVGVVSAPQMRGTKYFYTKREGDQAQAVLYLREEAFGEPRVLLDPNHQVKKGGKYPAVLFTAGENDARVHALHARKMTARLQAATASDPEQEPILLWVDRSAGHGQGKPLDLRVRDVADQRIFMMWQTGMLDSFQEEAPE